MGGDAGTHGPGSENGDTADWFQHLIVQSAGQARKLWLVWENSLVARLSILRNHYCDIARFQTCRHLEVHLIQAHQARS